MDSSLRKEIIRWYPNIDTLFKILIKSNLVAAPNARSSHTTVKLKQFCKLNRNITKSASREIKLTNRLCKYITGV